MDRGRRPHSRGHSTGSETRNAAGNCTISFLFDIDICSAHLKRPSGLIHRFVQHAGLLHIPTIVLGELYTWAYHRQNPTPLIGLIENDLIRDVNVLDFDSDCAKEFGRTRGQLLRQGLSVSSDGSDDWLRCPSSQSHAGDT